MILPNDRLTPLRVVKKEQRKGEALLAEFDMKPGHKLFKFNATGKLTEVVDEDYEDVPYSMTGATHKRLMKEPGTIYLPALNIKNATRKLRKMGVVK